MPRAGFEPATPATKRQQTYVLDRAATGIGIVTFYGMLNMPADYDRSTSPAK
jgi:hypothetical protein